MRRDSAEVIMANPALPQSQQSPGDEPPWFYTLWAGALRKKFSSLTSDYKRCSTS